MTYIELFNFPNCYMFFFLFRWLIGDEYSIHFSFMLSVLIKSATFLICLRNTNNTVSNNIQKPDILKVVSDLRQVCGILQFSPTIKLTATI